MTSAYDWDDFDAAVEGLDRRPPPPAPRHLGVARSSVLAAMMLGLQEVLEPEKAERSALIVPATPTRPRGVRVLLDPSPRRSVAVIPRS